MRSAWFSSIASRPNAVTSRPQPHRRRDTPRRIEPTEASREALLLDAFTQSILPVFAVSLVGYVLAKAGLVGEAAPREIGRLILYLAVPALMVHLFSAAPLEAFRWGALGTYALVEAAVFAAGSLAAIALGRRRMEAILWGFCASFVNSLLYVLPIAQFLYGDAAATPVLAVVAIDSFITVPMIQLLLERIHKRAPLVLALRRAGLHPMVWSPYFGLALNLSGLPPGGGLATFLVFAGGAAAPAGLFALGVTLAFVRLRPLSAGSLVIAALALLVQPGLLTLVIDPADPWTPLLVLVSAGPCGMLAYTFAIVYGVPHRDISLAILLTSFASLATLTVLA